MEVRLRKGVRRRVTAAAGGGRPGLPADVARTLTHLAHLLDERVAARGVGIGVREWAARFLEVPAPEVVVTTRTVNGLAFQLTVLAFADDLEKHAPAGVIGSNQERPPRYELLELGGVPRSVPYEVAAAFEAGDLADCRLVVSVEEDDFGLHGDIVFAVYTCADDASTGLRYLEELTERGRAANPFRGRVIEAVSLGLRGLGFRAVELDPVTRGDLVLPEAVWSEIDGNVHALFAALDVLARAGLGRNRGVLLTGAPGTGKTRLCRVLAGEVPEGTTVVFCDAKVVAADVQALYRQLEDLGPALVVMEDIDLVVADRRLSGPSKALVDFLLALDGAMSAHEGVVTVATTNDPASIDPAAKRAARFDRVVEIPPPDARGRAAILARYLAPLGVEVDLGRVAAATTGATGADLRELVTLAVLQTTTAAITATVVDTDLLLRLARERPGPPPGQYL